MRRELWRGRPWMGTVVLVVEDAPGLLAAYLPPGAPFGFPDGPWPGDGRHPWHGRGAWTGHGVLMLHRPGERYAVWHFWDGPERRFAGWYLNLQEPFRRTRVGFDTQDLELDIWIPAPDGRWRFKDLELLEERVREGRFSAAEVDGILDEGRRLGAELDAGRRWWDDRWSRWQPDAEWQAAPLPDGWADAPSNCLATERLLLRPVEEADRGWLLELYRALGDPPDRATREVDDALARWEHEGFGHFAATVSEDGARAGVIELTEVVHDGGSGGREVEIGWAVRADLRGRGLATEAAAAVAAHALRHLGFASVAADIAGDNLASRRVAEKIGMRARGPGRSRSGDPVVVWELRAG